MISRSVRISSRRCDTWQVGSLVHHAGGRSDNGLEFVADGVADGVAGRVGVGNGLELRHRSTSDGRERSRTQIFELTRERVGCLNVNTCH